MELSDADLRMIKWLHRQHNGWRSTRVITAVGSAVAVTWAGLALVKGDTAAGVIALLGMGAFGLSYSVGCWAGRPEISLLLKLVEQHRNEERASCEQGPRA